MVTSTRLLRRTIEIALPASGVIAILVGSLVANDMTSKAGLTLMGTALLLMRNLGLDEKLLPSERRYSQLRREVDQFITAVRRANTAAMSAAVSREFMAPAVSKEIMTNFETVCDDLVFRARRIAAVAGSSHGLQLHEEPRDSIHAAS